MAMLQIRTESVTVNLKTREKKKRGLRRKSANWREGLGEERWVRWCRGPQVPAMPTAMPSMPHDGAAVAQLPPLILAQGTPFVSCPQPEEPGSLLKQLENISRRQSLKPLFSFHPPVLPSTPSSSVAASLLLYPHSFLALKAALRSGPGPHFTRRRGSLFFWSTFADPRRSVLLVSQDPYPERLRLLLPLVPTPAQNLKILQKWHTTARAKAMATGAQNTGALRCRTSLLAVR